MSPLFDDLVDVANKVSKVCRKKKYIVIKFTLFEVPRSETVMSMSFDSSCRELKRDIIMLNFNASIYVLA